MPPALSADTSAAAHAVQLAAWRAMTHTEKLVRVRELTAAVLWLEREGLRRRHPSLASDALHQAAVERRLGQVLAAQAYPRPPRDA